jgi:hypothetical protein
LTSRAANRTIRDRWAEPAFTVDDRTPNAGDDGARQPTAMSQPD